MPVLHWRRFARSQGCPCQSHLCIRPLPGGHRCTAALAGVPLALPSCAINSCTNNYFQLHDGTQSSMLATSHRGNPWNGVSMFNTYRVRQSLSHPNSWMGRNFYNIEFKCWETSKNNSLSLDPHTTLDMGIIFQKIRFEEIQYPRSHS